MTPLMLMYSHWPWLATGNIVRVVTKSAAQSRGIAMTMRMELTAIEPIFLPAAAKKIELMVHMTDVMIAAVSPIGYAMLAIG